MLSLPATFAGRLKLCIFGETRIYEWKLDLRNWRLLVKKGIDF